MASRLRFKVNHKKLKRQPVEQEQRGDKKRVPPPKGKRK